MKKYNNCYFCENIIRLFLATKLTKSHFCVNLFIVFLATKSTLPESRNRILLRVLVEARLPYPCLERENLERSNTDP